MGEREKGRERKKGWKKRRVRGTNRLPLSLSLFFLPFSRTHARRERGALEGRGTLRRSETKLVAFRETRDGADGGDGGTPAQKRITRVITTLINKWASRRENLPSNRALEADARRSYLRPTSEASGGLRRPRSLSGPLLSLSHVLLLHQISPSSSSSRWSFLLFLSPSLSFSVSLLLLSMARAFTYTKRDVCTLGREDNGALDHALIFLSREFDAIACRNAWMIPVLRAENQIASHFASI